MKQQTPNNWEELKKGQNLLKAEVLKKEKSITQKCNKLFDPPPIENKLDLYYNYAKSAFSAYDGFMTGYRLLKNWAGRFRRKK